MIKERKILIRKVFLGEMQVFDPDLNMGILFESESDFYESSDPNLDIVLLSKSEASPVM